MTLACFGVSIAKKWRINSLHFSLFLTHSYCLTIWNIVHGLYKQHLWEFYGVFFWPFRSLTGDLMHLREKRADRHSAKYLLPMFHGGKKVTCVWIMMVSYISTQFLVRDGKWNSKACSPPSLTHWYWETMGRITALALIRHALVRKVSDLRLGEKRTNLHTPSVNFISKCMEMTNKAGSN